MGSQGSLAYEVGAFVSFFFLLCLSWAITDVLGVSIDICSFSRIEYKLKHTHYSIIFCVSFFLRRCFSDSLTVCESFSDLVSFQHINYLPFVFLLIWWVFESSLVFCCYNTWYTHLCQVFACSYTFISPENFPGAEDVAYMIDVIF